MKQKHFMDIENLREKDTELRKGNGYGFDLGDSIQISEKIDGSNACIGYDKETESLIAFSRKKELDYSNTLNGFWNYVQNLDKIKFADVPNYRIFGEWLIKNKIIYDKDAIKKWYVYDIYDVDTEKWLPQNEVKKFCNDKDLEYVHVLYEGKFISWEHCSSFLNSPGYGDRQEGIVVKNMTKLNDLENKLPFYLKIVNEDFKESMKTRDRIIDPEVEAAKKVAFELAQSIVTKNRVEKMLYKLRDEQILPEKINPQDMKLVAKELPKRIYEDCIKEEFEIVQQCGEYFGKLCTSLTMKHAKEIILN